MFTDALQYPQIYTLTSDNDIVAINGHPVMQVNEVLDVPLGFKTNVTGTFTFTATNLDVLSPDILVSLEDKVLNITQDLRFANTYVFTSGAVNNATRFVLHFNKIQDGVLPELALQNSSVLPGQNLCFNASQTITVAGNGTEFTVEDGGTASLVAGRNIVFLPGAKVISGGYLHGYITAANQYCGPYNNKPVNNDLQEISLAAPGNSFFRVYPNPTTGKFMIAFTKSQEFSTSVVHIYNIFGADVLNDEIETSLVSELSLQNQPPGIYVIRVVSGDRTGSFKMIKQ
jgi:hypothetical protein